MGGMFTAIFTIALRRMLLSRRTILLVLLGGVPAAATMLLVTVHGLRPTGEMLPPVKVLAVQSDFFLRVLLPLAGLLYGGAVIADEVDAGTLVYLWTRPVQRWALVAGRTLAAAIAATFVTGTGILALGAVSVLAGVRMTHLMKLPLAVLAVAVAAPPYAALFGAFGTWFRRPLAAGLLWAIVWENLVGYIPGSVRYLTISHYARSLFPYVTETTGWLAVLFVPSSVPVSVAVLLLAAAALVAVHTLWLRQFELRLSGDET